MTTPHNSLFLSIIIPACNEEKRIGLSLRIILNYLDSRRIAAEIIVVDDGSSDRTAEIAKEILAQWADSKVISFPKNRGKGAAVREGMLQARGELILFTDCDLSTPIVELEKFLPLIREGYQMVIASRALPDSQIKKRQSWFRERSGQVFNLLVRGLLLKGYKDTQCGFKLFQKEAARAIFSRLQTEGFAFDVEALLLAEQLGLRVAQLPVVWINSPESKVHLVKGSCQMLFDLLKLRLKKKRT
ncbi:MAG: glycosyltransferase family 2 protein [Acidobacteriota bacterium]|nr:glycosyltransferase family 2 protein [Acidobacteriota bacterium]MDW3229394.1 glycosyltransferase family 2 protein [Acidobacteriota bacterium]MDY0230954.1 glycosyltransferase family 2 protein [Candidatus Saccharicenans sp.]